MSFELNDDDVLSMENPDFNTGRTFKVSELKAKVREFANAESKNGYMNPKVKWFTLEGSKCDLLKTQGGGWQKGRLRFRLEFVPDEPLPQEQEDNSPLADLRSTLET
jgi:hypothetical protein